MRALVIGAGPAGLGAAARLAVWCDSVTVVEARARGRPPGAGEHLPPAGLTALAGLGLSALLDDPHHGASSGVRSAWGEAEAAEREYFFTAPGRGLNLRREVFDAALARHAEAQGAVLEFSTRLQRLARGSAGYAATLAGPGGMHELRADMVVDASGRRAAAARQLGAIRRRHDRLVALVGRIDASEPAEDVGRLHIEAAEDGWWYGVQLPDGPLICSYMTDSMTVRRHPEGATGLWRERLGASRLLAPLAEGGRWPARLEVFDAATQFLEPPAAEDFLAVGDAAMAFDPLSSWGIAKGLCDGHAGAEALERTWMGESGAVAAHRAAQRRKFETYRAERVDFYRAEGRWPASPFWHSRQALAM